MKILDFNKELNLRFAVTDDGRLLICDAENGREYKKLKKMFFLRLLSYTLRAKILMTTMVQSIQETMFYITTVIQKPIAK